MGFTHADKATEIIVIAAEKFDSIQNRNVMRSNEKLLNTTKYQIENRITYGIIHADVWMRLVGIGSIWLKLRVHSIGVPTDHKIDATCYTQIV